MKTHPLARDLDEILGLTSGLWAELQGQRLFITGGTGFIGRWLLESFARANDTMGLNATAVVLSRNPAAFREKAPRLAAHPAIHFLPGDVRFFPFPDGSFSHVIHAAAESSKALSDQDPLRIFETIVQGTERALTLARQSGARKFLLVSSGAVYGRQPPNLTHIPEDYPGAPDLFDPHAAYGEGKRAAELLGILYARQFGLEVKIARGFTFAGPYLPLDAHFAIGNFIRDALRGGPLIVQGDGTPLRSYLYAADLAVWLWTILFKGQTARPYNVGSENSISIAELARTVAECFPGNTRVEITGQRQPGRPPERYVPATQRAQRELNLRQIVALPEAIRRTIAFVKAQT